MPNPEAREQGAEQAVQGDLGAAAQEPLVEVGEHAVAGLPLQ